MTKSSYTIESLSRGLQVLSLFNRENSSLSLTQIKNGASLNKSTAFRVVTTLTEAGYLLRDPRSKMYRPGLKVLQLGFTAISSLGFRKAARPFLEKLSNDLGETVSLSVLDDMEVIYVDRVRQHQILGVMLGLGSRIPAHCASLGKAMLAYLPTGELKRRLRSADLFACTPHTLTEIGALELDLALTRQRGYAINNEEWVLGLRSTAAPVLDSEGSAICAVNISVSAAEISLEALESLLSPAVRDTAQQISHALSYMPIGRPSDY